MLNALYNDKILNFAAHIGQTERLPDAHATVTHHSPLCGSRITVDLKLADGKVAAYGQQVRACALGQAAASILGRNIVGQDTATLRKLAETMRAMLKENGPPPGDAFADLEVLTPVREHRARHNAVMLPFEAVVKAIDQIETGEKAS